MALVLNASSESAEFKVFGNHFSMKPGQIKSFTENVARFISINPTTKDLGLIGLPDELEDIEHRTSAEGKKILDERRKEGVDNRVRCLRAVIENNQVSLRKDLEMKNMKIDPRAMASDGELRAYEELVGYQSKKDDEAQKKIDRIKKLQDQLKDVT